MVYENYNKTLHIYIYSAMFVISLAVYGLQGAAK